MCSWFYLLLWSNYFDPRSVSIKSSTGRLLSSSVVLSASSLFWFHVFIAVLVLPIIPDVPLNYRHISEILAAFVSHSLSRQSSGSDRSNSPSWLHCNTLLHCLILSWGVFAPIVDEGFGFLHSAQFADFSLARPHSAARWCLHTSRISRLSCNELGCICIFAF